MTTMTKMRTIGGHTYRLEETVPPFLADAQAHMLRHNGYYVRQVPTSDGDIALYVRPRPAPQHEVERLADLIVAEHVEQRGTVMLSAAVDALRYRIEQMGVGYTVDAEEAIRAAVARR